MNNENNNHNIRDNGSNVQKKYVVLIISVFLLGLLSLLVSKSLFTKASLPKIETQKVTIDEVGFRMVGDEKVGLNLQREGDKDYVTLFVEEQMEINEGTPTQLESSYTLLEVKFDPADRVSTYTIGVTIDTNSGETEDSARNVLANADNEAIIGICNDVLLAYLLQKEGVSVTYNHVDIETKNLIHRRYVDENTCAQEGVSDIVLY